MASGSVEFLTALLPEALQPVDADSVAGFLEAADAALAAVTSERIRQLIMLRTSERWVMRVSCVVIIDRVSC